MWSLESLSSARSLRSSFCHWEIQFSPDCNNQPREVFKGGPFFYLYRSVNPGGGSALGKGKL